MSLRRRELAAVAVVFVLTTVLIGASGEMEAGQSRRT